MTTSLQRVLTTLRFEEPDRVPFFLATTLRGALDLGVPMDEYFSKPEHIVEAQLRKRERYGDDVVTSFFYGAIDVEPFGSWTRFFDDGPPNVGEPVIRKPEDILRLKSPRVADSPSLLRVLRATELLKAELGDEALILGVVVSPFGLPVMQMGFGPYLELMHERRELFERLMRINEAYCIEYANALLKAGAHAIGYFDPVSSSTILSPDLYRKTGRQIAKRVLSQLKGPAVTLLASGDCLPIIDDLAATGTLGVTPAPHEDLAEVKRAAHGRLAVIGNLNGMEMRRWTPEIAAARTEEAMRAGAPGGGFVLCDAHGEIPLQVPDDVLEAIAVTVREKGRYAVPLEA